MPRMKYTSPLSLTPIDLLFHKTSQLTAETTILKIASTWEEKNVITIHFVYFANIWKQNLLAGENTSKKCGVNKKYFQELLEADFLLPDGIAYRLLHFAYFHPEISRFKILCLFPQYSRLALPNMNGTDFVPSFLKYIAKNEQSIRIILYGSKTEFSERIIQKVRSFGYEDVVYCDGYGDFNYNLISKNTSSILLVGLGSPKQEEWIAKNREPLANKANKILIISVGGLFDFWSGVEKRAPRQVRSLHLEWLWRSATQPKKNLKKTLISFYFFWVLLFVR